jgi:hypothetical protein
VSSIQTAKMLAVYITDNENLIREDAVGKLVLSLMRRASVVRRDLDMVLTRHPKLRGPIAAQLSGDLKKIQAELILPATPENDEAQDEPSAPARTPAAVEEIVWAGLAGACRSAGRAPRRTCDSALTLGYGARRYPTPQVTGTQSCAPASASFRRTRRACVSTVRVASSAGKPQTSCRSSLFV